MMNRQARASAIFGRSRVVATNTIDVLGVREEGAKDKGKMMSTTEDEPPVAHQVARNSDPPSFSTDLTNISLAGDNFSDMPDTSLAEPSMVLDDTNDHTMESGNLAEGSMSMGDVPPVHRELSVRSGVADLPPVGEIRNDPAHAPSTGWTKKKICLVSTVVIVLLAIIIGVSVGVTNKNKSSGAPVTQSSLSDEEQRERLAAVANFLIDEGISFEEAVTTVGSPQNRAASFMAIDDEAMMDIPKSRGMSDAFRFIERYALAVYYYALGGDTWDFKMNFLTPDDTCLWYQTLRTTQGQRNNFGVQCNPNGEGKVSVLLMPWNNMIGQLPEEIGLLTDLQFLAIPSNRNLYGPLPEVMRKLTKLEFLHVAGNAFDGDLPEWIGDLTKLSSLALSDNNFQGSIPASISKMDALRFLSLDGNTIYGQMDALESMSNLEYLYLEHNQIEQGLGSDTLRGLTNLKQLDLSDNMLTGRVPRHLLHMPNLDVLDLSDNLLTGKLPATIPRNTALNFLFLHGNELTGDIPSSVLNLTALNHLDLSQNKFSGEIPSFLGNITNMVYLFLAHNDFAKGPLPEFVTRLNTLRDLSLKRTQLTGTIPTWIGSLQSLLLLDLDQNELVGTLPTELGLLTYLGLLLLNRNQLTGTIPTQISNMGNLGELLWLSSIVGNCEAYAH